MSVLLLIFTACGPEPTPQVVVHFNLVGSESMQWLARSLANGYSQQHPNVVIDVVSSNSEVGLRAGSEFSRTIGLVSRKIEPNELTDARAIVVARDGLAVIVNQKNPISAIQSAQIAQVFGGEILVWPTGPLLGQPIQVVSRESGSGTRHAFETMVMNRRRVSPTAIVMPGEAAVLDYVIQHPQAIGYVSMSGLTPDVRALIVDDVPLSTRTVESQEYPFVRTLAFVVPVEPDADLQAFIDFALGGDGQAIIGQRYGRAP